MYPNTFQCIVITNGVFSVVEVHWWRRRRLSFAVIVVSSIAWIIFEHSGLPFLSVCSDVLLILIVLLFVRANYAEYSNRYVCLRSFIFSPF